MRTSGASLEHPLPLQLLRRRHVCDHRHQPVGRRDDDALADRRGAQRIAEEGGDEDAERQRGIAEPVPVDDEPEQQGDGERDDDELAPFRMDGGPAPLNVGGDEVRLFEGRHWETFRRCGEVKQPPDRRLTADASSLGTAATHTNRKTESARPYGQDQGEEPRRRARRRRDDADHLAVDPRAADPALSRREPPLLRSRRREARRDQRPDHHRFRTRRSRSMASA